MNLLKPAQLLKPFILITVLHYCHLSKAQDSTIVKNEITARQLQPLIIDGKENDWPSVLPYTDKEAGIFYSITHDDSVVYICIKPRDEITKAKILRAGLTVFIDGSGKKKQNCSLVFPLPVEDEAFPAGPLVDLKTIEGIAFMHATQYRLSGLNNGNGTFNTNQKNDAPVDVKISFNDKGELIYEAAIPFAAFYTKQKITAEDNGKSIAVGFTINALSKPISQDNNSSFRKTSVDLSSQFYSSGNRQEGMQQMQQLYVKTKTWKIINLVSLPD